MNRIIKKSLQSLLIVPALALGVGIVGPVLQPSNAYAVDAAPADSTGECAATIDPTTAGIGQGVDCAKGTDQKGNLFASGGLFSSVVNVLLFIIGAVAVIMLVYGGIRYVLSGGDASAVTSAKNTILYAIVGIVIALLAYAVVQFVVNTFNAGA